MEMTYPLAAGYKTGGTSKEAADKVDAAYLQRKVMAIMELHPEGLTADECAGLLRMSILSIRPRFTELKQMGKITDTGERRLNDSGRRANVYRNV